MATTKLKTTHLLLAESAAPATPASGGLAVFATTDGMLHWKNDGGTEYGVPSQYGGIRVVDGVTAQTGITTTPVLLTAFAANGPASALITPDHTNDRITVNHTGVYQVTLTCSFSATANSLIQMHVALDGTEQAIGLARKMGAGGDTGSAACQGLLSITSGQVLTVLIETDNAGAGDSVTVNHANLVVIEV